MKMKTKYSDKELQNLISCDLIRVRKSSYYENKLMRVIKDNGLDVSPDVISELEHEDAVWDLCGVIHVLAQIILDERDKRKSVIEELKNTIQASINELRKVE